MLLCIVDCKHPLVWAYHEQRCSRSSLLCGDIKCVFKVCAAAAVHTDPEPYAGCEHSSVLPILIQISCVLRRLGL